MLHKIAPKITHLRCFTVCSLLLLCAVATFPRILRGAPAASPEEMVRARFSACRRKDAVFMAKTEAMREGKWQTTGPVIFVFQSVKETTTTSEFHCKSMQKYRITGSLYVYFDYFGLSPPPSNSGKCSIYIYIYRDTLLKIWCIILVVTVTGQETLLIHEHCGSGGWSAYPDWRWIHWNPSWAIEWKPGPFVPRIYFLLVCRGGQRLKWHCEVCDNTNCTAFSYIFQK